MSASMRCSSQLWIYYYNGQLRSLSIISSYHLVIMATSNRLKTKKRVPESTFTSQQSQPASTSKQQRRPRIFGAASHSQEQEEEHETYCKHKQANPNGIDFTMECFPHNHELCTEFPAPLGFSFSPLVVLQNDHIVTMDKNIDGIPRCDCCRAYMNCYNQIENNGQKYRCFLCNNVNIIQGYKEQTLPNEERNCPIFEAQGSKQFYPNLPPEERIVLMIDTTPQAAHSQMLSYLSAALREVLSRPEFDSTVLQLFTYDEVVHEYDFGGAEVKCMVIDQTIKSSESARGVLPELRECREQLFWVLEHLEEGNKNCGRKGSNFGHCLQYVYTATYGSGAQYFVFQANEGIVGEELFKEKPTRNEDGDTRENMVPPKSLFESRNKVFFDRYIKRVLNNNNTFFFFIFAKHYKNVKVLGDFCKISSSTLRYYSKDSTLQLNKFYYDVSYLIGATYFKEISIEFIISEGWHFVAIIGNSYRTKGHITFTVTSCEATRHFYVAVSPNKSAKIIPNHCTVQLVINYRYQHNHYVTVLTVVQVVTGELSKLYNGLNVENVVGALGKAFVSMVRTDGVVPARKCLFDIVSHMYKQAFRYFKKKEAIPFSVLSVLMGSLSMLKSMYNQPQIISNAPLFDQINAQRISLIFSDLREISSFFMPYLFNLTLMDQSMCREDVDFVYPPTEELRFESVKTGLFLLDCGTELYLYISKFCDLDLLERVFGKAKFKQNEMLEEEHLNKQETFQAGQVRALIQCLRQQKAHLWVPLHIVKWKEATMAQRNFYMHFTMEKYNQFKAHNLSFEEYLEQLMGSQ